MAGAWPGGSLESRCAKQEDRSERSKFNLWTVSGSACGDTDDLSKVSKLSQKAECLLFSTSGRMAAEQAENRRCGRLFSGESIFRSISTIKILLHHRERCVGPESFQRGFPHLFGRGDSLSHRTSASYLAGRAGAQCRKD